MGRADARGRARGAELLGELVGELGCSGVARLAAGVLHVVGGLRGEGGDVEALDRAGDAVLRGEPAHELLVLVGIEAAQPMVDVEDVQALAGDPRRTAPVVDIECGGSRHHKQGRRIGTARDHEHDGCAQLVVDGAAG